MKEVFSLITSLILIVLVLYAAYYFTKILSKKITNYSASKHMKIVDRIALSQNKFLLIVEVDKSFLLLGVADNNISVLKELDDLNLEFSESEGKFDGSNSKFAEILKENLLKNKLTSKFMKGNINYERDESNDKKDKE